MLTNLLVMRPELNVVYEYVRVRFYRYLTNQCTLAANMVWMPHAGDVRM